MSISSLRDKLRAALAFDELLARQLAPYFAASAMASDKYNFSDTESTIRFGYIHGREAEYARTEAIVSAMIDGIDAFIWVMPKVHQAHHEGELENCTASTCREYNKAMSAITSAIGSER